MKWLNLSKCELRYVQTSTCLLTINGYDFISRFLFGNYTLTTFWGYMLAHSRLLRDKGICF